ncbi:MAG: 2-keto-myo-inositol isomerase [Kiritimatiellia bacterium]|jgi:2-keto-myo-inositol isomerase
MELTRRSWMGMTGTAAATGLLTQPLLQTASAAHHEAASPKPWRFCLNMSTVRGQKLDIEQQIDLAGKAGYDAIEPWMGDLNNYVEAGKSLKDLKKRIEDHGMTVESAIGFAKWIVDDDAERAAGLETAKKDMGLLAQIGGKRIAAPPVGATKEPGLDLWKAAERYRALLELGDQTGVVPQMEVWGFSKNFSRLGESMFVVLESGHPSACLLADVYHIYKGGSAFVGLKGVGAPAMQVLHMNDYPDIPNDTINDADRVYPGDGVAPLKTIFGYLNATGARPVLSLELFNKEYWKQPAEEVAKTGLAKMKAAVAS